MYHSNIRVHLVHKVHKCTKCTKYTGKIKVINWCAAFEVALRGSGWRWEKFTGDNQNGELDRVRKTTAR
jgi:hypothetical protein